MNLLKSTKQFPKTHLVAGCSCVAAIAIALVLLPSQEVAAERTDKGETIVLSAPSQPVVVEKSLDQATNPTPSPVTQTATSAENNKELPLIALAAPEVEAKTVTPPPAPVENWLRIKVRSGDNLTTLFKKAGLGANEMYPLINGVKPEKPFKRLMPGQQLEFLIADGELKKLRLQKSKLESLIISKKEDSYKIETFERVPDVQHVYKQGQIQSSLFLAGQEAGLSQTKIMELAGIFGWDVDFALDIRKGDSFRLIYEELLLDGNVIKDGNIIAAEFINQGRTHRAIRYTDSKGDSNYFTPDGESMRKAFLRTPVAFARISSRFNPNRKHPIFKTKRPHRGVDYAAPTGTPIKSSGDGKVIFAGRKGGYGKVVIVQHGQKYTTLYAHMSRIKPGMKRGKRVKQGQTIGYVGSTGYATGPHLHYEFRVNGVHRNPLTVALPHARPLPKKEHKNFMPLAQEMVAQLETLAQTQIASK